MTILTVRGLAPDVQARLRAQAARHGRSMEAEARAVITAAVTQPTPPTDVVAELRRHFADLPAGYADLELPPRTETQRPVELPE